ncbi:hypothetical protein ACC783_38455, partial [Rhizobium ruizarguesonis]
FHAPPQDYVWNARCVYFADPDDKLGGIYAWSAGGPIGDIDPQERAQSAGRPTIQQWEMQAK